MTNEVQNAVDEGVRAEIIDTVHRFVQREVIPVAGHFLPREAPEAVINAVRELGGRV